MSQQPGQFYITTPIYYVNAQPHIGHVYTTTVCDIVARYHRMLGEEVFLLTGTDDHAAKVADSAAQRGVSPQAWADENAAEFQRYFAELEMTNDDFVRTSQERHKQRVARYVQQLLHAGDVYAGQYEGWYDAGQEEYVPEHKAKESDYKSPINRQPLVRKAETNYFFKLSKYASFLLEHIEANPQFIQPNARRNEVLARIREGLNDVPISRSGTDGWGIPMPNDPQQSIYVWIDALINYLSTVDTPEREHLWPCQVHVIGKDILWFHAVIWPTMLHALGRPLPGQVYAHSFWTHEGVKMSKSLDNSITMKVLDSYIAEFGLDAVRYYLGTHGPLGAADADFARDKFVEVYNADLANTLGNCCSRVANMTGRYFGAKLPAADAPVDAGAAYDDLAAKCVERYQDAMRRLQLTEAAEAALDLVRATDGYIEKTQPFKLAKQPEHLPQVATILYNCAEALRIAGLMLWPFLPEKMEQLWQRLGCGDYVAALAERGAGDFAAWSSWGQLKPGSEIQQGDALFPRYQPPK
jgi:methionyl-tRNA synthetase